MDFYEVVRTRRSVRRYRAEAVPPEVLSRVLDAARIAPSGSNRQPTRLVVVQEQTKKEQLAKLCHDQAFVAAAPVVVIACGRDIKYNRGEWMGRYSLIAARHRTRMSRSG